MKFKSDIEVQAGLKDSSGSNGTSGQVLSSDGTAVSWIDAEIGVASDVQNEVKAGVAINKGQAVYVTGADGTNIIVGLASNTSEATSSKTLGLLNATVATNGFADVVQIGKLTGLNTIGANVGDPVWLGTNGNLIYGLANKPYAPAHLVYIGVVTRVNANNGEIFVTVQNGFELKEIHDVDIITTPPTNGDVLGYDGTLWVNKTVSGWLGYTPANDASVVKLTGDQSISGKKSFNLVQTGYNLSLITSDIFNNGVISSDNGMLRLVNNTTSADLFRLESDGVVFGQGFKKDGGLATQYLMADGSVSTLTNPVTGSGTKNYIPKFTGASALGNSLIYDNGTNVGIGTAAPVSKLEVAGTFKNYITSLAGGQTVMSAITGVSDGYVIDVDTSDNISYIWNTGTNTPAMVINPAGNVSVGSTASIGKFTVIGTMYGGSILFNNGNIATSSLTALSMTTNGSERMRIAPAGNVGIGTTGPDNGKLTILKATSRATESSYGLAIQSNALNVYTELLLGADDSVDCGIIQTAAKNTSFTTKKLALQPQGGNTGIGGTSPLQTLDVFGVSRISSSAPTQEFYSNANGDVWGTINAQASGTGSGASLVFSTKRDGNTSSDKMIITQGGNVGIGTTSPAEKLHIGGVGSKLAFDTTGLAGSNWIGTTNDYWTSIVCARGDNSRIDLTNADGIIFSTNSTQRMRITSTGNVGIGTTSPSYQLQLSIDSAAKPTTALWTIASDARIKENINSYTKGLNELLKINPVTYDYNGLGGFKKGKGGVGIIAQEIAEILPDSVSSIKGKLNETDEEEIDILNFNGHELTYILINAVKELKAELEILKNK